MKKSRGTSRIFYRRVSSSRRTGFGSEGSSENMKELLLALSAFLAGELFVTQLMRLGDNCGQIFSSIGHDLVLLVNTICGILSACRVDNVPVSFSCLMRTSFQSIFINSSCSFPFFFYLCFVNTLLPVLN